MIELSSIREQTNIKYISAQDFVVTGGQGKIQSQSSYSWTVHNAILHRTELGQNFLKT